LGPRVENCALHWQKARTSSLSVVARSFDRGGTESGFRDMWLKRKETLRKPPRFAAMAQSCDFSATRQRFMRPSAAREDYCAPGSQPVQAARRSSH